MFNVGGAEMLVILVVALIVLGPNRLPDAARQAGKWMGEFRRVSTGFQREMRDAMKEISEPFDVTGTGLTGGSGTNGSSPSLEKPGELPASAPPRLEKAGDDARDEAG